jgi:hypothetical protein
VRCSAMLLWPILTKWYIYFVVFKPTGTHGDSQFASRIMWTVLRI